MKDALGHGSDAGVHSAMIKALPAKLGRRHFEQIAADLRSKAVNDPAGHDARVAAMADHLATTNPGFRRDLFVKASQPNTSYKDKSTREITKINTSKQLGKYRAASSNTGMTMSTKKSPAPRFNGGHFAGGLGKFKS